MPIIQFFYGACLKIVIWDVAEGSLFGISISNLASGEEAVWDGQASTDLFDAIEYAKRCAVEIIPF